MDGRPGELWEDRLNYQQERANYILKCAEKERDELQHLIKHSAPNDAIRFNGPMMLRGYEEKIARIQQQMGAA